MKKILLLITLIFVLISCSKKENTLTIGVSPIPHKEIVELVKEDLKKEGINLEIVTFNDYVQPNLSLQDKSLDANFFQHIPYMDEFSKKYGFEMVSVGKIHLEPLKIYSDKIKDINDIKENSEVLIPNDPTNRGRALILLDNANIIKLKDKTKLDSDINDIVENPKNIKIVDINVEQIPSRISEVDFVVINTNVALASNISKDLVIYVEDKESPYSNVVSVLKGNENDSKIQKLMEYLQSEKVKNFILEKYDGEIIPSF